MRVPVIKQGRCFRSVDGNISLFAYETDHNGTVTRASVITIHCKAPLSELREKYAAKLNIFPHEIDMFYENKEVFDDDTCDEMGIEHEQLVKMQVTFDTIYTKQNEDSDEDHITHSLP